MASVIGTLENNCTIVDLSLTPFTVTSLKELSHCSLTSETLNMFMTRERSGSKNCYGSMKGEEICMFF